MVKSEAGAGDWPPVEEEMTSTALVKRKTFSQTVLREAACHLSCAPVM